MAAAGLSGTGTNTSRRPSEYHVLMTEKKIGGVSITVVKFRESHQVMKAKCGSSKLNFTISQLREAEVAETLCKKLAWRRCDFQISGVTNHCSWNDKFQG